MNMWFGKIEELKNCKAISTENIEVILNFLQNNDMINLPCGKYDLSGDDFVNVFEYETKENDGVFEAHKKYTDVQLVITGKERVLWAAKYSTETKLYQEETDCSFGIVDKPDMVELNDKYCIVFLPGEAHKACVYAETVMKVKKAVFKLAYQ